MYGFSVSTCKWFESFLSNRTQRVKIAETLSDARTLTSGVPQGGILSPIVFTLYTADLNDWLKHSKLYGYADDISTSVKGKTLEEIIKNLKEDADTILSYMASNGLVTNAAKTVFMILNKTRRDAENEIAKSIIVDGTEIKASPSTNLLGMTIQENQGWTEHFNGNKGLIGALNKRTYAIRRIANQIPKKNVIKVVQSLWMSKLRYGLQLCNTVRMSETDPSSAGMKAAQVAQNKMIRMVENVSLKEHIPSRNMLEKNGLLSVNQLAAQIKLTEVWKSINTNDYPIELENNQVKRQTNDRSVRESTIIHWKEDTKAKSAEESFLRDAAKLWNRAPSYIKEAKSLGIAKSQIKIYCKQLPM